MRETEQRRLHAEIFLGGHEASHVGYGLDYEGKYRNLPKSEC